MRSISTRAFCAISLLIGSLSAPALGADFAYVLSRGTTPVLRGYKIAADGTISSVISTSFPVSTADTATSERKVIAYASKQKTLLVGLVDRMVVYKVEANGLLTPSPTPSIDFPGTRIDAVEVVEVGSKTFVYVGEGNGSGAFYGYRVLPDSSVVGIAGFPVSTQNPMTDLASDGSRLYSAQPSNNFVFMYAIASDGTLTYAGGARPESPCSEIQMSPNGNVLLASANDTSYVQQFEYFKKANSLEFTAMYPVNAGYAQPTVMSVGKKCVAVARHASDAYTDLRLFGIDGAGRLRVLSPYSSKTGMTSINSIAILQDDGLVLAISDTDDALKSFATAKKTGTVNTTALDTEPIPGLANVTTMFAIQR